jgi:uncharacterized membrane protein (Fun14 family)
MPASTTTSTTKGRWTGPAIRGVVGVVLLIVGAAVGQVTLLAIGGVLAVLTLVQILYMNRKKPSSGEGADR